MAQRNTCTPHFPPARNKRLRGMSDHVWSLPGTGTVLAESWNTNTNGREQPCCPHRELEHKRVSDHVALTGNWNMNNNGHERPCRSSPGSGTRTIVGVSGHVRSSPETGTQTGVSDHAALTGNRNTNGSERPCAALIENSNTNGRERPCGPHQELEHEHQRE